MRGSLSWAAGDRSARTVAIATTADALDEDDEAFGLLVASTTDTTSAPAVPVTITDDDPPPLLGAVPASLAEGDSGTKTAQLQVRLAVLSGRTVRVPFTTRDGSAKAGTDYTATSGTLTFAPGETAKTVAVRVSGDPTAESDETFSLDLGTPENATPIANGGDAIITITDDDGGGGADSTGPRLRLTALRRSGSRVTLSARCPAGETTCRGAVTLFTVASRRSPVTALRRERRLGRAAYRLKGNASRRLTLRLRAADLRLLRRARTVRVRAFAVTTNASGDVATTSRAATLRFG